MMRTKKKENESYAALVSTWSMKGRGHIRPYPKRGHFRPYPTILPIDCVIQPFRVRPEDKGLSGGTGENLGGTWGRSLSHFPHY